MGNELSERLMDSGPYILESRDIPSIAKYIKSEQCKKVFVMVSYSVYLCSLWYQAEFNVIAWCW
jgi:NAD-dependent histone deacetylase SIR2